ncbi:hypothetical protein M5585_08430 [Serratia ureilytica]
MSEGFTSGSPARRRGCIYFSPLREGLSFIELLQQIAGNLQLVAFGAELLRFAGSFLHAISRVGDPRGIDW